MKASTVMITISLMVGVVAVFLAADFCKPYRNKVKDNVPPEVRELMDKASHTIGETYQKIFGGKEEGQEERLRGKRAPGVRVFTKTELQQYDGSDEEKPIYLGIMGKVYDVTKGKRHYGKGGGYSFFSGRDGTRGFVTGEFDEAGLRDDVEGLSNREISDLLDWMGFYDKDYTYVGVLEGNFYDENGNPTEALKKVDESVAAYKVEKKVEDDDNTMYPPCNSEWSQASGSRLWCSDRSGGIERDWIGVPRIYKKPGQANTRCACVRTFGAPSDGSNPDGTRGDLDNPQFKEYEGCEPDTPSCKLIIK